MNKLFIAQRTGNKFAKRKFQSALAIVMAKADLDNKDYRQKFVFQRNVAVVETFISCESTYPREN